MDSAKHFLSIDDLSDSDLVSILEGAAAAARSGSWQAPMGRSDAPVGLLFLEPSTRTRVSFERAAQRLGHPTILVEAKGSSFEKGETLEDALMNLRALGISRFVVRTAETGGLDKYRSIEGLRLVNGGDGTGEHPSQALLDAATLVEACGRGRVTGLRGLRMTVIGDLRHSRVLGSWLKLAPRLGVELRLVSPAEWKPAGTPATWTDDKAAALANGTDVIMCLRIQKERMSSAEGATSKGVQKSYRVEGSDFDRVQGFLHPGPVNWGVEIEASARSHPKSLVLKQVAMGLEIRTELLRRYFGA